MISLIVAMAKNRVIGIQNRLPWSIPEDLRRFRALTSGHPIVMGRKTFDSIGKPLPHRTNIVVTRDRSQSEERFAGCQVVSSLEEALLIAEDAQVPGNEEIFIIGGGEIYRQALPQADRLYLTLIDQDVEGDAFFPEIEWSSFQEISRERQESPVAFDFVVLQKVLKTS